MDGSGFDVGEMSYQVEEMDECNECVDYVRTVADGEMWRCVGCGMAEATIYLGKREGVFLWHRYELSCGHQCHERCYRRWCLVEGVVGCPICGVLTKRVENQYCRYCDQWGHARGSCPRLRLGNYTGGSGDSEEKGG